MLGGFEESVDESLSRSKMKSDRFGVRSLVV